MFDKTICHPLSPARIRDGLEYPLNLLKNAWASATAAKLFPMPISTPGGRHPDAHLAMGTIAVNTALRTLSSLQYARATLFQRHVALHMANNAVCLMSGFDFEV